MYTWNKKFFFFFQLYSSLWVLACSIISFHCFLSCVLCFQLVTPSSSNHSSHRLPILLLAFPSVNNWALLAVLIFSGTRMLALCPTPNLEGQGVSLRLSSTLWSVRGPTKTYARSISNYARVSLKYRQRELMSPARSGVADCPSCPNVPFFLDQSAGT